MRAGARLALACAALLAAAAGIEAGCRKRRATNVLPHERSVNAQPLEKLLSDKELPKNFDWSNIDGHSWLAPSWNQHIPQYCGSCWLHGSLSMIQDRLKIDKLRAGTVGPDVMLARQALLNCAAFHGYGSGCDGGDVIDVLRYMKAYGLPDESCMPYSVARLLRRCALQSCWGGAAAGCTCLPPTLCPHRLCACLLLHSLDTATDHSKYGKKAKKCPASGYCTNCMPLDGKDTCWAIKSPIRYGLAGYAQLTEKGPAAELAMRNEIFNRGPLTCSMAVPEVFDYGYHQGIFRDDTNSTDVDHDVEVVGWGETDEGLKYWVLRNSWGTYWGELGFFRLERGVNALQIEAGDCWYALPTWEDEADVRAGRKVGTMWGVFTKEEAGKFKPEPGTKPHVKKAHRNDDESDAEEEEEARPLRRGNVKNGLLSLLNRLVA